MLTIDCTAAFAVPLMLCVSGLVALICKTVTIPIENPKKPATHMAPQKTVDENCWPKAAPIALCSNKRIRGTNITLAFTLL